MPKGFVTKATPKTLKPDATFANIGINEPPTETKTPKPLDILPSTISKGGKAAAKAPKPIIIFFV